jgi:signal transduction histidine kinase
VTPEAHNDLVGVTGSVSPVAAGQWPDRRPGGALVRGIRAAARAPFTARARRELLFCAVAAPLGLCVLVVPVALTGLPLTVTLLAHGTHPAHRQAQPAGPVAFLGPAVLLVLLALLVLAPRIARRLTAVHRRLAGRLLGEHIAGPAPIRAGRGPVSWASATLRDGPGWRAAGYLLVQLPLAVIGCYAVVIWWAAGLVSMTYPLWWAWFRNHPAGVRLSPVPVLTPFGVLHVATIAGTFAAFAAGAAMVAAAPWLTRAVVRADLWLMWELLGPGRLARRVADLEQARALAVDDTAAMLRRLERDLHDGAQIRLATLAMNLGMAMDRLATADDQAELAAVRELVGTAHQSAKDAMTELRDLARGIHPPALDTGLPDALATLAAASPVPVLLTTSIAHRPSQAIETIAYFCAAELLANAVKHSGASTITLTVTGQADLLLLRVADDGHGGADPAAGSGLAGLAQRARTVDGRLEVTSPPGGPTQVTVELPLHA